MAYFRYYIFPHFKNSYIFRTSTTRQNYITCFRLFLTIMTTTSSSVLGGVDGKKENKASGRESEGWRAKSARMYPWYYIFIKSVRISKIISGNIINTENSSQFMVTLYS